MPSLPLIVLADDLTGAAEVAGLAFAAGRRTRVLTGRPRAAGTADVIVADTGTRLGRPAGAARRVRAWAARLQPAAGVFKKTDSVLRGPVLAELAAVRAAFDRDRALLVAGNPSRGRIIRDGRCLVDGAPVDATAFARDPHHPARSADVLRLLRARPGDRVVSRAPGEPWPRTGVIVGEHRGAGDTVRWAQAVDPRTLPAGGADFFRAWLRTQVPARRPGRAAAVPAPPCLLVHGTTATPPPPRALPFRGVRAPAPVRVAEALRHRRGAAVAPTPFTLKDPLAPARISASFARLVPALRDAGAFRHLLIAGGATAAAVLRALGWDEFDVVRLWGPGVVSLRPLGTDFTVTLKPGSYPWPAALRRACPGVFS